MSGTGPGVTTAKLQAPGAASDPEGTFTLATWVVGCNDLVLFHELDLLVYLFT